jgi:hypothetical protein
MIDRGVATQAEMVLEFLRPEVHALITFPKLDDEYENYLRAALLNTLRGYPDALIFKNFPRTMRWRRYAVSLDELRSMKYIADKNWENKWSPLSKGTRLVGAGADNVDSNPEVAAKVRGIAKTLLTGAALPRLIAVRERDGGELVLLEGHHRATAFAIVGIPTVEIIVGTSPGIVDWPRW